MLKQKTNSIQHKLMCCKDAKIKGKQHPPLLDECKKHFKSETDVIHSVEKDCNNQLKNNAAKNHIVEGT